MLIFTECETIPFHLKKILLEYVVGFQSSFIKYIPDLKLMVHLNPEGIKSEWGSCGKVADQA